MKPRQAEIERIRSSIHEIAGSGLTLSKLSVTASLLGDLVRSNLVAYDRLMLEVSCPVTPWRCRSSSAA